MSDISIKEILDRVRRTETRVTKIGRAMGVDVGGGVPTLVNGRINVPSPNCSIGEIAKLLEAGVSNSVVGTQVFVGDDYLATIRIDRDD